MFVVRTWELFCLRHLHMLHYKRFSGQQKIVGKRKLLAHQHNRAKGETPKPRGKVLREPSTNPSSVEQLCVSKFFLQNKGGGSSFIRRDDFQNTLSAWRAVQSKTPHDSPRVQAPLPETQHDSGASSPPSDCVIRWK